MADSKRGALRRDVRLTRSHLWAAASGTVLIALLSFWAGTHVGQGGEVPETLPGTYTGQAASEELVALLARVETAADTRGGVDQMTFPAALTQSSGGGVTNSEDVPAGRFHVQVARFSDVADARRLRDLLRAAEVHARFAMRWLGVGG